MGKQISNKNTRRFLLVSESSLPYVCGVSTIVDEILKHFSQLDNWDIRLIAPDYAPSQMHGVDVIGVPSYPVSLYNSSLKATLPLDPRVRRRIKKCIQDYQPDVIMTLGGAFLAREASRIGKSMNIPVLGLNDTDFVTYANHYGMGFLSPLLVRMTKWIHRANTMTLVSSPSYLSRLREMGFSNLKLWRFGMNTARFSPSFYDDALRKEIASKFPDTTLICLCVSRLAAEKSIDDLLGIAKLDNVTLVIVGDGPERSGLEKVFAGTRTIFWGALYDEELARMYASADVFLTASRSETFGLTVLEAMASGTPSVIIDGNGIRDTVVHEETGFIGKSPQEMTEYVRQLRDDKALLDKLTVGTLNRISDYSWDKSINNLSDLFIKVTGESNQSVNLNRNVLARLRHKIIG